MPITKKPHKRKAPPKKALKKNTIKDFRVSPDININTVINDKKAEATDNKSKKVYNQSFISNETLGRVGGKQTSKIREFFIYHPDEDFTPSDIAFFCRIPKNTAKVACWRLEKKGFLTQPLREHYAYKQKITFEELASIQKTQLLTYHNIRLSLGYTYGYKQGVTPPSVPFSVTQTPQKAEIREQPTTANQITVSPATNISKDKTTKTDRFNVGTTRISAFHYPQKIIMYIECSEQPLDCMSLNRVLGVIEGRGYNLTGALIVMAEANIDVPDLRIHGANCIELKAWVNCWQRMYNKGNRLREEVILRGKPYVPLEEGVAALVGKQTLGTASIVGEMQDLKKQIKHNEDAMVKMSNFYRELVTALDEVRDEMKKDKYEMKRGEGPRPLN